jgi:ubiquinone/menaquinone biosynthesis C-methylase UbiE
MPNTAPPGGPPTIGFDALLASLQAAGEVTRLRLIGLLSEAELTVSELVAILGQSQPRVSRHLKLLVEAGLAERQREGAWAFYRLADRGGALARALLARVDPADATFAADRTRLAAAREARRKQAAAYFAERAADWDAIRALHASESRVEAAIMAMVGDKPIRGLLDLGTGTGRMLELLAPRADRAVGVDMSPAMLAVARARIGESGLRNVQLRQGDLYAPPVERDSYDLVVIHQVLHFLDDPARALAEAARALRPAGRLLVVDFAAHGEESLRERFAHRRLGFADEEIAGFLADAGLAQVAAERVAPAAGEPDKLTVALWLARDRRVISDLPPKSAMEIA